MVKTVHNAAVMISVLPRDTSGRYARSVPHRGTGEEEDAVVLARDRLRRDVHGAAIGHPAADGVQVELVPLSGQSYAMPSVLFLPGDGYLVVGEDAQSRSLTDPERAVREFKSRVGDEIPLLVGGTPYYAHDLAAEFVSWICQYVTQREGERAASGRADLPGELGTGPDGPVRAGGPGRGRAQRDHADRTAGGGDQLWPPGARGHRGHAGGVRPRRGPVRRHRAPQRPAGRVHYPRAGARASPASAASASTRCCSSTSARRRVSRSRRWTPATAASRPKWPSCGANASRPRRRCRPAPTPSSRSRWAASSTGSG